MVFRKPNFGPPPEGYIAGLGRGATGFVTRADYGPAKIAPMGAAAADLQVRNTMPEGTAAASTQQPSNPKQAPTGALREFTNVGREDFSESNYDEWSGYGGNVYAPSRASAGFTGVDDAEDNEADQVFNRVDEFMDSRRKKKREEKLKEIEAKISKEKAAKQDLTNQFKDLKGHLADVSRAEWESLPDAPDLVKRSIKQREAAKVQKYMPVPDSVINSARLDSSSTTIIDPNSAMASTLMGSSSGFASTMNSGMMSTNLTELGQARGQLLQMKLDKAQSDSVIGKTPQVNKEGYMTDLNSLSFNSMHEINDFKKARALLKSVITSNPNSASGWIAAARVEELDGKIQQARNIIAQATQNFLDNEDIWLEAARLSPPEKTKALLAKAVSLMPKSKKLWLQASRKEQDMGIRKSVLMKALEQISSDIEIWKETISLSNPDEAKALLYKATEAIPDSTELWLALAKLETYENARIVLNKAIEHLPADHTIWTNAAKLEEAQGNTKQVEKIVSRSIKKLSGHGIKREQWLREAVSAEESGSLVTCRAIIQGTMEYGIEDESGGSRVKVLKRVWLENADACIAQSAIETARAIYFNAIKLYPLKKSLWFHAIKLEEQYGSKQNVSDILTRAKGSTKDTFSYLKLAKHVWKSLGDAQQTSQILHEGFKEHPDSEDIVLALQKFERENKNYEAALEILEKACSQIQSERVHMQAVQLQREIGNLPKALELVEQAIKTFTGFYKLWLIKAQVLEKLGQVEEARKTYDHALQTEGVKQKKQVWICFASFEIGQESYTRARTILQKARIRMADDEDVWVASVKLEIISDNIKISQNLLSQALQKCPSSGKLWALFIELEPAATRKAQVMNALKANENDSNLFVAIAKVFWVDRKGEKIRKWLSNAVKSNKDNGDAWAHLLRYEMEFGTAESKHEVLQEFKEADPHHGEVWPTYTKKVENWRVNACELLEKMAVGIELFKEV